MALINQEKKESKNKENEESPFLQSPKSPPPQAKTSGCISSMVDSSCSEQSRVASLGFTDALDIHPNLISLQHTMRFSQDQFPGIDWLFLQSQ